MAVIKMKPTSPGRRGVVKVSRDAPAQGSKPYAPLLEPQIQKAGRNNNGHITTRHKGGGHKHHYRVVDFVRNKDGIPAKVERIEYDPNRTAHIALVCYADGERRYIIAPRGLEVGATLLSGSEAPIKRRQHAADPQHPGRLDDPLHRDAARQGRADRALGRHVGARCWRAKAPTPRCACARARCARSTSTAAPPSAKSATKSTACASIGKAGAKRWKGIRPTVRGVAMNPVDHPHGGGEGTTGEGRHPVSPWGNADQGLPHPQQQAHADR